MSEAGLESENKPQVSARIPPSKLEMNLFHLDDSDDGEMDAEDTASNELTFIAQEVRKAPIILSRSQIPETKSRKDEALLKLVEKYCLKYGKITDSGKILKKINNMKTRLKKKNELKNTGNKVIKLGEWEKELTAALGADHSQIIRPNSECSTSAWPIEVITEEPSDSDHDDKITFHHQHRPFENPKRDPLETAETKNLSLAELQRLVLLEQLKTTRAQREYYEIRKHHILEKFN